MSNILRFVTRLANIFKGWNLLEPDSKGRCTFPSDVRHKLQIREDRPVLYRVINGVVVLVPVAILPEDLPPDKISEFVRQALAGDGTEIGDAGKVALVDVSDHEAEVDWFVQVNGKGFLSPPVGFRREFDLRPKSWFVFRRAKLSWCHDPVVLMFSHKDSLRISNEMKKQGRVIPFETKTEQPPVFEEENAPAAERVETPAPKEPVINSLLSSKTEKKSEFDKIEWEVEDESVPPTPIPFGAPPPPTTSPTTTAGE